MKQWASGVTSQLNSKPRYRWWRADNGVWIWADVRDLERLKPGSFVKYLPLPLPFWN